MKVIVKKKNNGIFSSNITNMQVRIGKYRKPNQLLYSRSIRHDKDD